MFYFTVHDPLIHNPTTQYSYVSYVFLYMLWTNWLGFSQYSTLKCFLDKLGSKNGSSPNQLKLCTGVHCYMLIKILTSIFSSKWLKFLTVIHYYMLNTIVMFVFSIFLSFIFFWVNMLPKSKVLQIKWNCWEVI